MPLARAAAALGASGRWCWIARRKSVASIRRCNCERAAEKEGYKGEREAGRRENAKTRKREEGNQGEETKTEKIQD